MYNTLHDDLLERYPDLARRNNEIVHNIPSHPSLWSAQSVEQLNEIQDTVQRAEALRSEYAFYILSLGTTVGVKCDLNQPLLSQIPS